jgi:hypothetical protein
MIYIANVSFYFKSLLIQTITSFDCFDPNVDKMLSITDLPFVNKIVCRDPFFSILTAIIFTLGIFLEAF